MMTLTLSSQHVTLQPPSSQLLTQRMRTRLPNPNSNPALLALIHPHSFSFTLTHSTYYISNSTYYFHWLAKARSSPCSILLLLACCFDCFFWLNGIKIIHPKFTRSFTHMMVTLVKTCLLNSTGGVTTNE